MSRKRIVLGSIGTLAGLVLIALVSGYFVVRSQWFYEKVRLYLVETVETATGGRVEADAFRFDWQQMRAEIVGFTLHGKEPAGKPPLFRASSVAVGIHVVSFFQKKVNIRYLDVVEPRIYLIVESDGRTNVPEPKLRQADARNPAQTILDLAVGRFGISRGVFEVEGGRPKPFSAQGRNLNAQFQYERAPVEPRYRGTISIQPLDVTWPDHPLQPFGVDVTLALQRNHIDLTSVKVSSGQSRLELSGAVQDLASPHGSFDYAAQVAVAEAAPIVHIDELKRGTLEIRGQATWDGSTRLSTTGTVHGFGVQYRDSLFHLDDSRVDAALFATLDGIDLNGIKVSTRISGADVRNPWPAPLPVDGQIAHATQRGRDLEFHGVVMRFLGGDFRGEARVRGLERYSAEGAVAGMDARRSLVYLTPEPLPWDAIASGPVTLEGSFRRKTALRITGNLAIAPAAEGAPVHGQMSATYAAADGTLDLGRSTLSLPSSRADFSGVFGRELKVHLETHDLNDVLPVLGMHAASTPVKLEGGAAVFDGTVTGKFDDPHIAGHLGVTQFSLSGRSLDSLEGTASVSPDHAQLDNATVTRGALRAQFHGAIGLIQWKADDHSTISGGGTTRNANIADLAKAVQIPADVEIPAGALTSTAQVGGTVGSPTIAADLDVAKGSYREEPFDRFTARFSYAANRAEVASGQISAGTREVQLSGTFDRVADRFDAGHLRFQVATNVMPLNQIRTLEKARPGVEGTVQLSASGEVDILPPGGSDPRFRIDDLRAELMGKGLGLNGQALGDTHLTATSQGQVLSAQLESAFANSAIHGDGEWRLTGDYPGTATIRFSKLDFAQLKAWIAPSQASAADRLAGSAEGELHLNGPALKPASMKTELRIPKLEIGPAPGTVPPAQSITLTNSGPIVVTMVNSIATIDSARLVGRSTDLSVTGRVLVDQKNPLDLRVNGRIDLGIVQTLARDFTSSGSLVADAAVRGTFSSPQVTGRMQFQTAAFALADFPNGISNANGVILFTAERATIQSFSGETGGGKIELAGSAGYSGGATVFQLQAHAREVRVRYPEGVSTVLNADLNLTGTPDRSMLDGTVTILRTGLNLQSDFSSVIAKSAEPVRTPAAQTGILGGLNYDIQINTDPNIQLQSSLTEDLQADANLRLRGTVSNPGLVGRVSVTQGQVVFYGTKYRINQGTIAFYNALKVEPILDFDLDTKANGIDITLTVAGPLNKLRLTPRSDPPLQFSEIVSLLATGRTPTSDPTLLAQQTTAPQSWQQMGASALLGQAIANPVAGRLQRFFGVSKLRIDPTLPGVENNPQARLTLEQQVTPDITFTYITNVTTSNPQVVRVEWALSPQWSVVALRDENGTFGLDFFFKKRF